MCQPIQTEVDMQVEIFKDTENKEKELYHRNPVEKEFPEGIWQGDDVNLKRNEASERHANRPIYYINPNSDDQCATYMLQAYDIYWQIYMQIYIWIRKLEVLVIIGGKDIAAKGKKMKFGYLVKYVAASKRILTNPAPQATGGIPNEDPFCHINGEYLNDGIYIKSKYDSTFINLYRKIIRNETCRMMTSIDIVVSEAKHLFGVVRTHIFFDLLDAGLFHFGSAGDVSDFVPNMAESAVRQHVISFFEHASDTINRLRTLLLGCPDSKILQQMPEPMFVSLLQSVIVSFLSKNKGTKEIRLIAVEPRLFEIAPGEGIPVDNLVRFRQGDEMVMNRFVDAGLEIMQRDNRPNSSVYFPTDCRLLIYIPTENGSYWHKKDMLRDNRIRRHGK